MVAICCHSRPSAYHQLTHLRHTIKRDQSKCSVYISNTCNCTGLVFLITWSYCCLRCDPSILFLPHWVSLVLSELKKLSKLPNMLISEPSNEKNCKFLELDVQCSIFVKSNLTSFCFRKLLPSALRDYSVLLCCINPCSIP